MTNTDVRMKGFASRTTVEAALAWIDTQLPAFSRLATEVVSLFEATGRVLAEEVFSRVNVPGFRRSMMDGFALRAEETYGATAYNALPLEIIGDSLPGLPFQGIVNRGQAVRIMTGAPMPDGADAVLPVEQTLTSGTGEPGQTLLVTGELSAGKHLGAIGEDVCIGASVLSATRIIRPQDVGVLSSIGCSQISVIRKPQIRILITGNEVLPSGTSPHGYQITDANGPMLHSLVTRDGGLAMMSGIIPDDPEELLRALAEPADMVIVSGGSSVGLEDHAPRLLEEHGTLAIHGIAMRPSSPAGMGRFGDALVFLLPGNPVSCLCAYDFFAGRAIRALAGRSRDWPYQRQRATLRRKLVSTVGRVDYARVKIDGEFAEPVAISGASILTSTTQADGFVIIPADSEGYAANTEVEILLY
jgi:molybdopterin molybdotransferase